jgi:hypothetical protein
MSSTIAAAKRRVAARSAAVEVTETASVATNGNGNGNAAVAVKESTGAAKAIIQVGLFRHSCSLGSQLSLPWTSMTL